MIHYIAWQILIGGSLLIAYYLSKAHLDAWSRQRQHLLTILAAMLVLPLLQLLPSASSSQVAELLPFSYAYHSLEQTSTSTWNWEVIPLGLGAIFLLRWLSAWVWPLYFGYAKKYAPVIKHASVQAPFAFGPWVFLPANEQIEKAITDHELAHVRFGHSYERILVGLFSAIAWFNPCFWIIQYLLKEIHEYQADQYSREANDLSPFDYGQLVLQHAMSHPLNAHLSSHFSSNHLKKRIMMLNITKRPTSRRWLWSLPLLALLTIASFAYGQIDESVYAHEELSKAPEFAAPGFIPFMASMIYPEAAKSAKVEGRVFIQFIIEADGSTSNFEVLKSPDERLSQAALNHLRSMPKWTPGEVDGKKVRTAMVAPVVFRL